MEHYITKIHIDQVRHLKNVDIELSQDRRKHLILTGKNGSGKTSLLNAIKSNLQAINDGARKEILQGNAERIAALELELKEKNLRKKEKAFAEESIDFIKKQNKNISAGIDLSFNTEDKLEEQYFEGKFITAYFPADRLTKISVPHGVEDVKLKTAYHVGEAPVRDLIKYLVHLKTQQAYAQNEGDINAVKKIDDWFKQFEDALQKLMDDDSIKLKYDYKNYNFIIEQKGKNPFGFNELSDGFSAAIYILADLLMRMDQGWLLKNTMLDKTIEGVVLIDEIETHLHLELQKSILSNVTYEGIVEGYFGADTLSATLREKFEQYKKLLQKSPLTDDDYDEIMSLEQYLDEIPDYLSIGIAEEYAKLKLEFQAREDA